MTYRQTWEELRSCAATCRNCDLWEKATQTVFGEGPVPAELMVVGEQPGDEEDRKGSPFVGPAGRVLDRALSTAGLDRDRTYVTNAVKHFRWDPRGKRRIHKQPSVEQVRACRPWLEAELGAVRPKALTVMGATAARSLFGPGFKLTQARGHLLESDLAPVVVATAHPSSVLRMPDAASREAAMEALIADLEVVAAALR